jgi:hypothetical protein
VEKKLYASKAVLFPQVSLQPIPCPALFLPHLASLPHRQELGSQEPSLPTWGRLGSLCGSACRPGSPARAMVLEAQESIPCQCDMTTGVTWKRQEKCVV